MSLVQHLRGQTFHGRKGGLENQFRYAVDYVLMDPTDVQAPRLFSHNAANLTSVQDRDHGGAPKQGRGVDWAREVLAAHNLPVGKILLLTQARVLGHVFNPVSFWLCHNAAGALCVVIAEVSNTFGERHSYLCHRDDLAPLTREDTVSATKIFHVSPFQPVEGGYQFRFDIRPDKIGIWIDYSAGNGGLIATLTGKLQPLTLRRIMGMALRFGSRRVVALIFWQALKLRLKGAKYNPLPTPPEDEVSR